MLALLRRQLVVDGRGEVDRALARPRLRLVKKPPALAPHDRLSDARHAALDDPPARLEGFEGEVGVFDAEELARAHPRQEREDEDDVREVEENSRRRNAASQSRSQTHVTLIGQYSKISAVSYIARPAKIAGLALAKLSVISQLD